MCPEGAATYAAYKQSLADGRVKPSEQAVLFNCATGLKYPLPPIRRTLDRHKPIDFSISTARSTGTSRSTFRCFEAGLPR